MKFWRARGGRDTDLLNSIYEWIDRLTKAVRGLALIIVLAVAHPARAAVTFGCESRLVLETLAARGYRLLPDHAPRLGLPGAPAPDVAAEASPDTDELAHLGPGFTHPTDVGWTFWRDDRELAEWQEMARRLHDGPAARRWLELIRVEPAFCPAPLSPTLCKDLRRSTTQLENSLFGRGTPSGGWRGHEFPWRAHARAARVYITPGDALNVMKVLAREALLRHLLYRDHAGRWALGADMDLETRVAVASRMSLSPLAAWFAQHPVHLLGTVGQGLETDMVQLVSRRFAYRPFRRNLYLHSSLDVRPSRDGGLFAWITPESYEPSSISNQALENYRRTIELIARRAAHKFATMAHVERNVEVDVTVSRGGGVTVPLSDQPDVLPRLDIKPRGLGRLHLILYYNYLALELDDFARDEPLPRRQ